MNVTVERDRRRRQREAFLRWLPYVRELRPYAGALPRCDGIRWGEVSMRVLHRSHTDPEALAPHRCRNDARWHFRALRSSPCRTGRYCTNHLYAQGVFGSMSEEARTLRYAKRYDAQGG